MTPKTFILLCVVAFIEAGNVFGGGHQHGFQAGGFRGPLFTAAATPGLAASDSANPPQPYSFGYDTTDEFGTKLFHKEQGDANNVKTGSYGYRDAYGLFRTVSYVADAGGFRATVDTNEPGTAPGASADATFNAKPVAAPAVGIGAAAATPGRYVGARPGGYAGGAAAGGSWAG